MAARLLRLRARTPSGGHGCLFWCVLWAFAISQAKAIITFTHKSAGVLIRQHCLLYIVSQIKKCAGYELCCPSTRGLAPSRHWKLRTKQYDFVHPLFPSLSCQLTPLRIAKYSERVNSVSWRFPSYGIWHVGAAGPRFIVARKDVFACVTLQADCQLWFLVNFSTKVFFQKIYEEYLWNNLYENRCQLRLETGSGNR